MKIVNVTPGLIPIPPNGWGAVEKIIWEIHNNLKKLGHDSTITYLNDVPKDADIVHIHVANLANMAKQAGIPYYFTMHDHHAYLNGKDSWTYKENLEAIRGAIKSFVPAKYLIDYFEGIPEYSSHGVNTDYFTPTKKNEHRLLCVANNGYGHDQSLDRKGFGVAIEVARQLNLPITIVGPSNNRHYFEKHPPTYDKLTILYDLDETQLLSEYKRHSIFIHPSELEAGHPNLTLLEAMACGLPVVGTFENGHRLDGMRVTGRSVPSISAGISDVIYEYQRYQKDARGQAERLSWMNRTLELVKTYEKRPETMLEKLLKHYNNTKLLGLSSKKLSVNFNNVDGPFFEIAGVNDTHDKSVQDIEVIKYKEGYTPTHKYQVNFINKNTLQTEFSTQMGVKHWAKANVKYFVDWKITVQNLVNGEVIENDLDFTNKRVLISLESKSLGDTLAWVPYIEEFRLKHNCQIVCSTFWNHLFKDEYTNIEFVEPGQTVDNLYALYRIGLFYNEDGSFDTFKNPSDPTKIPLQKVATDILGLTYKEIKPKMKQPTNVERINQVSIAIHSTAQTKYWNNSTGWQQVVDWLKDRGYTVKLLSQEENGYMGNYHPTGIEQLPKSSIDVVINELKQSKVFIGIGSGLTWLSWATNTPTVLISGFSDAHIEMQDCIRLTTPVGKCTGCWSRHKFNPGDWNWCPDHKGTPRQFECSREISADMVIRELEKIL